MTVPDGYPISRKDEFLDYLGESIVFSSFNSNWGYWKIPIHSKYIAKTNFTSHFGTFMCKRNPFGLKNEHVMFQRAVNIGLSLVKWKLSLVYIVYIIVFIGSFDEHFWNLTKVLYLMPDAGFSLMIEKCFFFRAELDYLGHVVSRHELWD